MDTSHNYRLLTLADVEPAARVISQAFVEDPLCAFMLPFRRTRLRTLVKFFRLYGELNIAARCGFGVGEPLQGVAFWQFPTQDNLSISVRSLTKFLPLLFTFYPVGLVRARAVLRQIEALHQRHVRGPHYYLDNIGVLPRARGQGLASRLIRPVLEQAEEEHTPVYTDTVTQANVAIYEHFGFACVEETAVPGTGIIIWALRKF